MVHRIRKAVKDRDIQYTISGIIELDVSYKKMAVETERVHSIH